jgi:hypothetical protein
VRIIAPCMQPGAPVNTNNLRQWLAEYQRRLLFYKPHPKQAQFHGLGFLPATASAVYKSVAPRFVSPQLWMQCL